MVTEIALDGRGRFHLDTTTDELATHASVVELRGWVALDSAATNIAGPLLCGSETTRRALARAERLDVERVLPDAQVIGFDEVLDVATLARSDRRLEVHVDGRTFALPLELDESIDARAAAFERRKADKLARLAAMLACPSCRTPMPDPLDLACTRCGYIGVRRPHAFELLAPGTAASVPEPPFSANAYDPDVRTMIEERRGGLLLDAGAGLRYEYFDDVVNLEIADFPTVDVIASCTTLPFRDASFDGAISVAVLEHVPDPQRCAEELARVVRPGGVVYVAVPFLQPYHGYPDHYFNATQDGLRSMFSPHFEIDELSTPPAGHPMVSLNWFLRWYLDGLPEDIAREFSTRTVAELAADPRTDLFADYVVHLSPQATRSLAAMNLLRGTRRG